MIGAVLAGVGGGIANALVSQAFQGENMANQNNYTLGQMDYSDKLQRSYTHDQYNLMKSGLTTAGFNPLTMFHGAGNTQESLSSSTPTGGNKIDLGNLDLARAINEGELMQAQTSKLNAEAESIRSKLPSELKLNEQQSKLYDSQISKIASDIGLNTSEATVKLSQAKLNDAETALVEEKIKGMKNGDLITKIIGTDGFTAEKVLKLASIAGGAGLAAAGRSIALKMMAKKKVVTTEITNFINSVGARLGTKIVEKSTVSK